jgi:8-oxo-dGTP pyrophosphatase MutT (NUDIX family)
MADEGKSAPEGANGQQPPKRRSRRRRRKPQRHTQASTTTKKPADKGRAPAAQPSGPVQKEISAGGVVYRRDGDDIEVVLASRRTRRGDLAWGLAKGGVEEGETMEQAAIREVLEETGLTVELEASLGETKYFYVWGEARIRKTVHFFLMRFTGGDPEDRDDEMEEVRWFPLERALVRAAYRGEREILERAAQLLR